MYSVDTINIALEAFAGVNLAIILISMMLDKNKRMPLNRCFIRILQCALIVLLFDIVCWLFDGNDNPNIYYVLVISNFCVYTFSILCAAVYHHYIIAYISTKTNISKASVYVADIICLVHEALLVVSLFNHMLYYIDEANRYCRGSLFFIAYIVPTVISGIQIIIVLRYRKKLGQGDTLALLSYNILLLAGVVVQSSLDLIMLLYVFVSIGLFIVYIRIQVEQGKRLETEIANTQVDVMLSQIQPHFLYNTLTTIENMVHKDADRASKMIIDFSEYLRENMDSLNQKGLIPFERELKHVSVYLDFEKVRFKDDLKIIYDFELTDFYLPILTVQPIVENAVRHGVMKTPEGGTVSISTRRVRDNVVITVTDDGVGFDLTWSVDDGRSHVGLENVQNRLMSQCGGALTIENRAGAGTKAIITIPTERRAADENN